MPKRKKTASVTPLLNSLSAEQAQGVLAQFIRDDPTLASRAEGVARDVLRIVGSEEIAGSLAGDLAGIEIEDV